MQTAEVQLGPTRLAHTIGLPPPTAGDPSPVEYDSSDFRRSLLRVVESEITPRLLSAHSQIAHAPQDVRTAVSSLDTAELARLSLTSHFGAQAYIRTHMQQGDAVPSILVNVLAPAARHLGEWWKSDACDFVDVTVGMRRLRNLARELAPSFGLSSAAPGAPRILLSCSPGETHSFGLDIVETAFGCDGWEVERIDPDAAMTEVDVQRYDIIGFSIGCARFADALRTLISEVRVAFAQSSVYSSGRRAFGRNRPRSRPIARSRRGSERCMERRSMGAQFARATHADVTAGDRTHM